MLGAWGDSVVKKLGKTLYLTEITFQWGKRNNKKISKIILGGGKPYKGKINKVID